MNVTCPNCATIYRVDPAKVPEAGVRARCAVCNAVFAVRREADQGKPAAALPAAEAPRPAAAAPARPEPPKPAPAAPVPPEPPKAAAPPPKPEPPKPAQPPLSKPEPSRPAAPAAPSFPPRPAPPAARPAAGAPVAPPAAAPPSAPARAAAPAAPAASPAASAAPKPAAPPSGAASSPAARPVGARPANPFLSQDPSLKAKRLARALISDMVVYHPGKRQEGLRDGNLKELFEEEIKKSWEEYAEQVGRDVAESTPHFREALNEILAGGRQIF